MSTIQRAVLRTHGGADVMEVASGTLNPTASRVVGFADIPLAIERNRSTPWAGKVLADFSR